MGQQGAGPDREALRPPHRQGSVGILPAHARRVDAPKTDVAAEKRLLRSQLRSEPEEMHVASSVAVGLLPRF